MSELEAGREMYAWARDLFPVRRSLTGDGVRRTLQYLGDLLPELVIREVPSGTECFGWTVPDEWNIRDAFLLDEAGRRIIDFQAHNLHVVGYSEAVDKVLGLEELQAHLHSLPEQPDAIPYVPSYYKRYWGFCLTHAQRLTLTEQRYRAVIDSTLQPGHMSYGEVFLPGETDGTILLSTYVCHPSMANNELSGPVLATAMGRLLRRERRRCSYLILVLPETIGAIYYLSRHLPELKKRL
ncbi:MAG: DUF4910 domain-containing protein, partial [Deltaproteobacteria bacterium]|nr:DUF4910 domain-containing protein [Deltaproteobacteria bacterium]